MFVCVGNVFKPKKKKERKKKKDQTPEKIY